MTIIMRVMWTVPSLAVGLSPSSLQVLRPEADGAGQHHVQMRVLPPRWVPNHNQRLGQEGRMPWVMLGNVVTAFDLCCTALCATEYSQIRLPISLTAMSFIFHRE